MNGYECTNQVEVIHVDSKLVAVAGNAFSYFGALMGFLFGYFVFDNVSKAKFIKDYGVGGYMGAFTNLMLLTGAWFPETDAETMHFKDEMLRLGCSVMGLFASFGSEKDADSVSQDITNLVAREMLTEAEADYIRRNQFASVPIVWMESAFKYQILKKVKSDPMIPADYKANEYTRMIGQVDTLLLGMRGGSGTVLAGVTGWGHQPLPLVHLMSGLVKFQFFLLGVKEGLDACYIMRHEPFTAMYSQLLLGLLVVFFVPVIFQSLLEVVVQIRNPFGDDYIDYPKKLFHKWLRDELNCYLEAGNTDHRRAVAIIRKLETQA